MCLLKNGKLLIWKLKWSRLSYSEMFKAGPSWLKQLTNKLYISPQNSLGTRELSEKAREDLDNDIGQYGVKGNQNLCRK